MGSASSRTARWAAFGTASLSLVAALLLLRRERRVHGKTLRDGESAVASDMSAPSGAGEEAKQSAAASSAPTRARTGPSSEEREWARRLVATAFAGDVDAVSQQLQEARADLEKLFAIDTSLDLWTNITGIGAAALGGHAHVIQTLLSARADADVKCTHASSWDGAFMLTRRDTALCIAAQGGHRECVQTLLLGSADPNVRCDSEYLEGALEWGDDDDGSDMSYYSALDSANQARHPEIAELIRQSGGREMAEEAARERPTRMKISSGSRMGA
mmetsp:Transcript_116136/g.292050  ORF Transcript_116136/g.292050 Transcript_116136/m.292050 type:complete len:273 (-) Transcript_116136:17-835(-)